MIVCQINEQRKPIMMQSYHDAGMAAGRYCATFAEGAGLSLIHISEPTRPY